MTRSTYQQILAKMMKYCAYQERSHFEVRNKIVSHGLYGDQVEEIMAELVQGNYLNEERFARSFAGGKFRMKNWGRDRITYELDKRQISDYCIRKAMEEIDEEDYIKALDRLIEQKMQQYSTLGILLAKDKALNYCTGRGFEIDLVIQRLRKIN